MDGQAMHFISNIVQRNAAHHRAQLHREGWRSDTGAQGRLRRRVRHRTRVTTPKRAAPSYQRELGFRWQDRQYHCCTVEMHASDGQVRCSIKR
jgi:hypothetical protein